MCQKNCSHSEPDLNVKDLTTADVLHIINEPFFRSNPTVQNVQDKYRIGYKPAAFLVEMNVHVHQTIMKAQRKY